MDENLKERFKQVVDDFTNLSVKFGDLYEEFAQPHPELQRKLHIASDVEKFTQFDEILYSDETLNIAPQLVLAFYELSEKTLTLQEMYLGSNITKDEFYEILGAPGIREKLDKAIGSGRGGNPSLS